MKGNQNWGEVDRNILDTISLYGNLEFLERWYEIGVSPGTRVFGTFHEF
jgi:hypothetical protein